MNNKYLYLIVLLIFGVIISGCISDNSNNYHDKYSNESSSTLKINGADNYSKQRILAILNNTDQDVAKYISSVSVVPKIEDEHCGNKNSSGCASADFTTTGKLVDVRIYLLDRSSYKGSTCNAFDRILYHEIGHVAYFYKFGDYGINLSKNDKFYQEALETYADRYADEYSKADTEGCNEEIAKQLEQIYLSKEETYRFAERILSKWDKYKDSGGAPQGMKDEYLYDYYAYVDAKKEYEDASEKFKDYLKKSQELRK